MNRSNPDRPHRIEVTRNPRHGLLALWTFAILLAFAGADRCLAQYGEVENEFVQVPTSPFGVEWNNFEVVLQGNLTSTLPVQNSADPITDAFAAGSGANGAPGALGSGNSSIFVGPVGANTVISYLANDHSSSIFQPGLASYPNNTTHGEWQNEPGSGPLQNEAIGVAHFGITGVPGTPVHVLDKYWTSNFVSDPENPIPSYSSQVPVVNVNPSYPLPTAGPVHFITIYINFGGGVGGEWAEFPFSGPAPDISTFGLSSPTPDFNYPLSNMGFFLSDTQIPLDDLNDNTYPGFGPGSQFTPVPSDQFPTIMHESPEPGTFVLAGLGGLGLGVAAWRRKRHVRT